jgi:uncharacterized protein (DUF488 family)
MTVFSVGHSTRTLDDFIALVHAYGITRLADVRAFPASRRLPHFNASALDAALAAAGIAYRHLPDLGGRRKPLADSPHAAWQNASFRGYADYMQTASFARGLELLLDLAASGPTVMMCAEAVWWRCHRRLIADALTARGIVVRHVVSPARTDPHELTPFARIDGPTVSYPGLLE